MNTNSTTALDIFKYNQQDIRVIMLDGQPWWVASDACKVLEIANVSQAINGNEKAGDPGLDDDEKLVYGIYISGQNRQMLLINESGLYSLIFKSRKPEAKAFKRWVTHEILPAIRKTGSYTVPQQQPFYQDTLTQCDHAPVLYVLTYGQQFIRVTLHNGSPWFVVNDLCQILNLDKTVKQQIPDTYKQVYEVESRGGKQTATHVNEAGIYLLLAKSNEAQAGLFTQWLTQEALPVLRRQTLLQLVCVGQKQLSVQEIDWRILRAILLHQAHHQQAPSVTDMQARIRYCVPLETMLTRLQVLIMRGDIQAVQTPRTTRYSIVQAVQRIS